VELILVDTSVWVEHLNRPLAALSELLIAERCVLHPFVLGEIALGNLPEWEAKITRLRELPSCEPVTALAFLSSVAELRLQGSGLGFLDAQLLAWAVSGSARRLWSLDQRLAAQAVRLGVGWPPAAPS